MDWFEEELVRVELGGGAWVEISKYETEADNRRVLTALSKGATAKSGEANSMDFDFDLGAVRQVNLENRVKKWSFVDGDKAAIPVTPENIGRLPRTVTDKVLAKINDLEAEQSLDDETKNA